VQQADELSPGVGLADHVDTERLEDGDDAEADEGELVDHYRPQCLTRVAHGASRDAVQRTAGPFGNQGGP
jgi:hypothetical protein